MTKPSYYLVHIHEPEVSEDRLFPHPERIRETVMVDWDGKQRLQEVGSLGSYRLEDGNRCISVIRELSREEFEHRSSQEDRFLPLY